MVQHFDVLDAVWALDTDPTAKLVALRLARHWPRIFPGIQDIAHWTQLDERTVRRALRRLETDGVIRVTRREGSSSFYEFPGVSIPSLGTKPPLAKTTPGAVPPPPGAVPPPPGRCAPTPPGAVPPEETSPKKQPEETKEGEARELMPHERAELRKAEGTGTRRLEMFEFPEDWKPSIRIREVGLKELGLTEQQMRDKLADCRLKHYPHAFTDPNKQFERELRWLRVDLDKQRAREARKANPHGLDENPGARRRPGDPAPDPIFGRPSADRRRSAG